MSEEALDFEKSVSQYVVLRDLIKQMDDAHKEGMKAYRETLEKLNSDLLDHINSIGGESVRTAAGTVYRTERKTASLADPDAFMEFVKKNQAFELLDRKVNATAAAEFIAQHHTPPPGVNYTVQYLVGVRRGTNGAKNNVD
jgi:hypothetical protein